MASERGGGEGNREALLLAPGAASSSEDGARARAPVPVAAEVARHTVPTFWDEMRELSILSVPVALSTLARLVIINTDTAFVGHLVPPPGGEGGTYLAAASFANTWNQFLSNIVFAPGYALNSLCSQAIGAGNKKLAGVWLQLAIVMTSALCVPVLVGYVVTGPVVRLMVPEKDRIVAEYAQKFNMVSILVLWPMVLYMIIRQYFQAMQIVTPAMVVSGLTVGFNYGMNALFVPDDSPVAWGFEGSPFATFISMLFQIGLFLAYTVWYMGSHKPYWGGWTWESLERSRVSRFMKMVVPMAIGIVLENSGLQLISFATGHIGQDNIAAHAVLSSLWGILWAAYWGMGLALQVRVGSYLGQGNVGGAKQVAKISIVIVVIICFCAGLVSWVFAARIAKIFSSQPAVQKIVSDSMYALVLDYFFACMALCAVNLLEAMAQNRILAFTLSFGMWAVQVPFSLLFAFKLPHYKDSPVEGIWMGQVVGELFKMFVLWTYILRLDWDRMCREALERSEVAEQEETSDVALEAQLEDADEHFAEESAAIPLARSAILGHQTAEGMASSMSARTPSPFIGATRSPKNVRRID